MKLAGIINENGLVSKEDWEKKIKNIRITQDSFITDYETAVSVIVNDIIKSIKARLPNEKFGILFSGGIDSLIIAKVCKDLNKDFVCYTVGTIDSSDMVQAEKTSREFGFKLKKIILTERVLEKAAVLVKKLLDTNNPVTIEIASVIFIGLKNSDEKYVFTGLGAEEIFAGYRRHMSAKNLKEESWNGLSNYLYDNDLRRDFLIASHLSKEILTPFLDINLIRDAMRLPDSFKIRNGVRKYILSNVGKKLGLGDFSDRKKKAAQYGSNAGKVFSMMAKKTGVSKKEYFLHFMF